MLMGRTTASV